MLLGAFLSGCIEMTQLFTPNRHCSTDDLLNNIIGSATGVVAGIVFERMVGPVSLLDRRNTDPSALALLFCQAAALTFPLFPVVQLPVWRQKILAFVHGSMLNPVAFLSAAVCWFAIAMMIRAARLRHPNWWLALAVLLIPAQIAVVTRQPLPVDLLGALAASLC